MSFWGGYFSFSTLMFVFDYNHDFFFLFSLLLPPFRISSYLIICSVLLLGLLAHCYILLLNCSPLFVIVENGTKGPSALEICFVLHNPIKGTKCSQKLLCFVLHSPIKGTKHFQNVFCLLQTPSKGLVLSKCVCLFQPT